MLAGKLAFAGLLSLASLCGGVGLGSYTVGGFRTNTPPDIIGLLNHHQPDDAHVTPPPAMLPSRVAHVCTGCDASLFRDPPMAEDAYGEDAGYELGYDVPYSSDALNSDAVTSTEPLVDTVTGARPSAPEAQGEGAIVSHDVPLPDVTPPDPPPS
jgi:hypothetical protein